MAGVYCFYPDCFKEATHIYPRSCEYHHDGKICQDCGKFVQNKILIKYDGKRCSSCYIKDKNSKIEEIPEKKEQRKKIQEADTESDTEGDTD